MNYLWRCSESTTFWRACHLKRFYLCIWFFAMLVLVHMSLAQHQFTLGTWVEVTVDAVRVREMPGLSADVLGNQPLGSRGVIVDATPHYADGYWWWRVSFQTGLGGWVAQGTDDLSFIWFLNPNETVTTAQPHALDISNRLISPPDCPLCGTVNETYATTWKSASVSDVQAWLDSGGDVNAQDAYGYTVLMVAVAYNQNPEVIARLIQAGADVNAETNETVYGYTALMAAVRSNPNLEIITLLLDVGANINTSSFYDDTPGWDSVLAHAMRGKDREIIDYLIERGANVNDPFVLANAMQFQGYDLISRLVAMGADINQDLGFGLGTVFMSAVRNQTLEVIKLLLDAGASLEGHNRFGDTVLIIAATNPDPAVLRLIIDAGAFVEGKDGANALTYAIQDKNIESLRILLEAGADMHHEINSFWYETPFEAAMESGNPEIINLFLTWQHR